MFQAADAVNDLGQGGGYPHHKRMNESFFSRNSFRILLVVAFGMFFILMGTKRALKSNKNDPADWLPSSFKETAVLRDFQKHFVGDQFIVLSWEGCTLRDPDGSKNEKLELLAKKLIVHNEVTHWPSQGDTKWPFKEVITGPRLLEKMTSEDGELKLEQEEAIRRLQGLVIGPEKKPDGTLIPVDDRQTCLVVTLSPHGTRRPRAVVGRTTFGRKQGLLFRLMDECSIPPESARGPDRWKSIHMGGPLVDSVAIDEEGETTLIRLVGLVGIVGLCISWWCFRSFKITFMVFATGVSSALVSIAFVWYYSLIEVYILKQPPWFGTMDAVLMSMPAVVYVLGLSGAIHLINYYRDAVSHEGIDGAADKAIRIGWGPCALAAVTTAVGLGSLFTSNIVPIQKFGIYSAIGVLVTLVFLFLFLPALLQLWPPSKGKQPVQRSRRSLLDHPAFLSMMRKCADFIIRRNAWVSLVGVAVIIVFAFGLPRINTSVQLLKLFSPETKIIKDYHYLEDNLGRLVPMEVLIEVDHEATRGPRDFPQEDRDVYQMNLLERMEMVHRIGKRIERLEPVGKAISAATFADKLDQRWGKPAFPGLDPERVGRDVLNKRLNSKYVELRASGYLSNEKDGNVVSVEFKDGLIDVEETIVRENGDRAGNPIEQFVPEDFNIEQIDSKELWRISLRVAAFDDIDYWEFSRDISQIVEPVVATYRERDRLIRLLAEREKSLQGSKICILGVTEGEDLTHVDQSLSLLLMDLLHRAGAEVSFHDPSLKRIPKSRPYNLPRLKRKKITKKFLAEQDLVLITGHLKVYQDAQIPKFNDHVEIIDLNRVERDDQGAIVDQPGAVQAVYTGAVTVVYKAQRELLKGLVKSICLAFVIIAVVMMVKLRGVMAGLLSMIPNIFPVVLIFGYMGWTGILIDIGAMMTASVALGVAVDDTVHFLHWFRHGMLQGLDRKGATMLAYQRCARAMFQTTLIGGLGLAIFGFSTFTPTQRFGVLMLTILFAALVGDLILLPALLAGSVGKFFGRRIDVASKDKQQSEIDRHKTAEQLAQDQVSGDEPAQTPHMPQTTLTHIRQDSSHRSIPP